MPEENWVEVGTATTNRIPDSNVDIFLDLDAPPICPNMTDAEFRRKVIVLTKKAVSLVDKRMKEVGAWDVKAQERVSDHFGTKDEAVRQRLIACLPRLRKVLDDLGPKNFVRTSEDLIRHLGCMPSNKNVSNELASVCGPNTATHTICIAPKFCTTREYDMYGDSQLATIVHEASHFHDTFSSEDVIYTMTSYQKMWAKEHPDRAINNADNIAGYIVYGEDVK
ncbi:Lysine-specific metallo-endopeptidase [Caballeronia sp. SBC1]|uniref:M35 family metallo-endopeptidase n=1 Tax=unclassified Caballeronia TaxID=2646786 RepID=UPI0013E0EDE9|nr:MULTISPECIES: M35 family metallo-endopeptidase [unclassified Caballeronia]QIE25473.1 Lysine-specific metallo-endopeptidase [Caballeronia sp. SBC2]QIN63523.1 Lysine-specific metallo-endopeptidase [Caballeronia sp. SBC1]